MNIKCCSCGLMKSLDNFPRLGGELESLQSGVPCWKCIFIPYGYSELGGGGCTTGYAVPNWQRNVVLDTERRNLPNICMFCCISLENFEKIYNCKLDAVSGKRRFQLWVVNENALPEKGNILKTCPACAEVVGEMMERSRIGGRV